MIGIILRPSLIESRQISMNVSMPMEDANNFVETLKVALNVPAMKGSLKKRTTRVAKVIRRVNTVVAKLAYPRSMVPSKPSSKCDFEGVVEVALFFFQRRQLSLRSTEHEFFLHRSILRAPNCVHVSFKYKLSIDSCPKYVEKSRNISTKDKM